MSKANLYKWSRMTLIAIYLVILAGSVVRMTGSGMGCPDWPRCFGNWIPPTDVSQLPENYQEIYAHRGYEDTTFNVFHTWTEYVNRLVGALAGLFVLGQVIFGLRFWKTDRLLVGLIVVELLLMGFQAWLGAVVVYSVLAPVKITIHMVAALVIVALNLVILVRLKPGHTKQLSYHRGFFFLLIAALLMSLTQIVLGTQVRQEVDEVAKLAGHLGRENWIDQLSGIFKFHRSFAILVLGVNGLLVYLNFRDKIHFPALRWMAAILLIEIASGVGLSYLGMPAYLQPTHLLLATVLFGVQCFLMLDYLRQLRPATSGH